MKNSTLVLIFKGTKVILVTDIFSRSAGDIAPNYFIGEGKRAGYLGNGTQLRLLAVWMDGNLALYPSSIVFLQIPIQQALRKTLLTRTDVRFPLSLLIWIGEDISYATRINDSPCSDRTARLNLSVHPTQEPVVRMPFQSALKKQYSQILDLRQ